MPNGLSFFTVSNLEEMVVSSRALVSASSVDVTSVSFSVHQEFYELGISTLFG